MAAQTLQMYIVAEATSRACPRINPTDMQSYMIETAEKAQQRYEKNKKKPAPVGVTSFNAKTLYKAYLKRTGNVPTTPEEYERMKETAPEFYRAADSMLYGVSRLSQVFCTSVPSRRGFQIAWHAFGVSHLHENGAPERLHQVCGASGRV